MLHLGSQNSISNQFDYVSQDLQIKKASEGFSGFHDFMKSMCLKIYLTRPPQES